MPASARAHTEEFGEGGRLDVAKFPLYVMSELESVHDER